MLEPFLIKPFFSIILIAISSGLLGVFVLWKKLSYFGDALSHSVLLGLTLATALDLEQVTALSIFAITFSSLAGLITKNQYFSKDATIMILSYFCVALAIILNDLWVKNFYFSSYIFGDLLAVGSNEVQALAAITTFTIFYVIFAFKKTLLININEDLAKVDSIKTEFWNTSFLIFLSLVIALSVKIVGVFLMTALLILPASIARIFSTSPLQMLWLSLIIAVLVSLFSFEVANFYNLTVSSAIVTAFSTIFIFCLSVKKLTSHE